MADPDNSFLPHAAHPGSTAERCGTAERWLLGVGVAGAFSLAFQATRPLEQLGTAPGWFNWICLCALGLLLLRFLARGKKDERWLSLLSLAFLLAFVGLCEPWSVSTGAEFTSRAARLLSTTHFEVPLLALAFTWLALGIGLLCGRAVLLGFPSEGPWQRASAWLLGLLIAAFGAHGVMGYASGNASLLLP